MSLKKCVLVLLLAFCFPNVLLSKSTTIPVLPLPKTVEKQSGYFSLNIAPVTINSALLDTSQITTGLSQLRSELYNITEQNIQSSPLEKAGIILGIPKENKNYEKLCRKNKIWPNEQIGTEGYTLLIKKNKILLAANTANGLFYGIQTLNQLIRGNTKLECMQITDWPDFNFRCVEDDISRGPVPTLEYMKTQIRRCAELKYNMVSYYTEHVVETEKHKDFAPTGGSISINDWKELVEYGAQYHVQLVGNFQSFGHFEKILAYPQYDHLGEAGRMLTPTKEESYELLSDIYSEMVPVFPAPFFHVNSDETWDLGRGASKNLVDSLGIANVYSQHLNRISQEITKYGKRMMMWADIALAHPEILQDLPKETVMATWEYSDFDSFDYMIQPLQKAGFDVMICPGIVNSRRIMPDFKVARKNIRNFLADGHKNNVLGVLLTVWDDAGTALFSRDWYGVAYAAEQSWHVGETSDTSFDDRFDRSIYGDENKSMAQTINIIKEITHLAATQEMNEKIFWSSLFPNRGSKITVNLSDWEQVLEICEKADSILYKANPVLHSRDMDYIKFSVDQYFFMAKSRFDILEAAQLYRKSCLNQEKNRAQVRHWLTSSFERLLAVKRSFFNLKIDYQKLWYLENRSYWLDHIMEKYDNRIRDIDNVITLLRDAIRDFDNGHYLPPPNEVRLDVQEANKGYFQSWLLCGPFPNPQYTGKDIDYLASMGGEANTHPTVWSETEWPKGTKVRWRKFTSPLNAKVNLGEYYKKNDRVLAYAYCRIASDQARTVKATFGSNDGIVIYCNGEKVFEHHVKRNLIPDEEEVMLRLNKGTNYIMLKIDQGKGNWGFSFRLPDVMTRNHDYKYRIID